MWEALNQLACSRENIIHVRNFRKSDALQSDILAIRHCNFRPSSAHSTTKAITLIALVTYIAPTNV
jgi:hypothetical protein